MKKKTLIYPLTLIMLFLAIITRSQTYNNEDILEGCVIIKVKTEFKALCFIDGINHTQFNESLNEIKHFTCNKKFPHSKPPESLFDRYGRKLTDITLIYEILFSKDIPVSKAISILMQTEILEYAVPHVIHRALYTPNDPGSASQYHLPLIKAFQAWDISQGDTNVCIGILDTGTDFSHPDLSGNIKYNYYDLPDGIDNDNDGYVDNYRGWDIADNDNNPQFNTDPHGVHVSGIASAKTDNGLGVAGVGFRCKFMPIKIAGSDNSYSKAYEGIVYAAEQGCDVINCSWGSKTSSGAYGQDIINYAVINKNAVVVAACGNDNNEQAFYPASYKNVISVAATDINDIKNGTSSYGIHIDISAPGKNIFSTWSGGSYINYSGTSMAAPVISGCAAIVKSVFPNYNAQQIAEKLRSTADVIDTIGTNVLFEGKLGSGRVNLHRAITESKPSVRIVNIVTDDGNDNIYNTGDTLNLSASFINYLENVNDLTVSISSQSQHINILHDSAFISFIPTMGISDNNSSPFIIEVLPGIPASTTDIEIKVRYSAANYSAHEYFTIKLNKDYADIETGMLSTSITGRGKIGFNDYFGSEGLGFKYKSGKNILYCGGLMIGNNSGQVSDNVYGATGGFDEDFKAVSNISASLYSTPGFISSNNIFNDSQAGAVSMGLTVKQTASAYTNQDSSKFVMLDYIIKNNGASALQTLYAGLFIDWDINKYSANSTLWDASLNMSYSFPAGGGQHAGIMLIYPPNNAKTYAFDADGSFGSINLYDGFSAAEKYSALNGNRFSAGQITGGKDIAAIVSSGPHVIMPGDSTNIVFALLAGDNLYDLRQSALKAKDKYYNISGISGNENLTSFTAGLFPNPASNSFTVYLEQKFASDIIINIFDVYGKNCGISFKGKLSQGYTELEFQRGDLPSGVYMCNIQSAYEKKTIKLILN